MRKTQRLIEVAMVLLDNPNTRHFGYELSKVSGVRSGILYPMLGRLLEVGWLTDAWEAERTRKGRPPRRYYELTDLGRLELGAIAQGARTAAPSARPEAPTTTRGLAWGMA
jgi:PadR family transcriptional regulator PadR